jgi:folylpolyglutamate synthase/dihydropteroate synthase
MTYHEALRYLYGLVDYEKRRIERYSPREFKLARVETFLEKLGNPHEQSPTVHIAGTKGKGSVSAMMAACAQAGGLQVGLYTSPHLHTYRERIQVNAAPGEPLQPISRDALTALVEEAREIVPSVPDITTFEVTTALAFLYFAREGVDLAVMEVGLGGRLDATNVITPYVSLITSLSLDHTYLLGDTIADIAREKGGIIKPGIPVVSAPQPPEAVHVLETIARERGAPLMLVGRDWTWEAGERTLAGQRLRVSRCSPKDVSSCSPKDSDRGAGVSVGDLTQQEHGGARCSPKDVSSCSPKDVSSCSPKVSDRGAGVSVGDLTQQEHGGARCSPKDVSSCSPKDVSSCSPKVSDRGAGVSVGDLTQQEHGGARCSPKDVSSCSPKDVSSCSPKVSDRGAGVSVGDLTQPQHKRDFEGEYYLNLLGDFQQENATLAVAATAVLNAQGHAWANPQTIHHALAHVRWPGRLEMLHRTPPLVVDCAHNPYSAQKLVESLQTWFPDTRWVLIYGASTDKDIEGMLRALLPISAHVIVTRSYHPRAATPYELADQCADLGPGAEIAIDSKRALAQACEHLEPDMGVLVTGSIFLVADVREVWGKAPEACHTMLCTQAGLDLPQGDWVDEPWEAGR